MCYGMIVVLKLSLFALYYRLPEMLLDISWLKHNNITRYQIIIVFPGVNETTIK